MTTVTYKAGIMAGDTRGVTGELVEPGNFRKVFKFKDGTLMGFSGEIHELQRIVKEIKKNPTVNVNTKSGKINALRVSPDGKVSELDDGGWIESDAKYFAIGSGRVPALIAMRCGKSAREAVKIAHEFDRNTGDKIQTVRLK